MILVPALLSLLIGALAIGLLAKLAVRVWRGRSLGWGQAFAYGALVTTAGVAGLLLRFFSGFVLPGVLGAAIALVFHALAGGWFLGARVKDGEGRPVGFRSGALLGLAIFALVLAMGFLFGALQGIVEMQGGTVAPV